MSDIVLLGSFVDFELYPLVEKTITVQNTKPTIKNLSGSNQKQTLIVYSYEIGRKDISKDNFELLRKIFAAIKYDLMNDTALLGITPKEQLSFGDLGKPDKYKHVVSFGPNAQDLGLNAVGQKYAPTLVDGTTFVFADPIQEIASDKTKKMSLWKCLQATFLK